MKLLLLLLLVAPLAHATDKYDQTVTSTGTSVTSTILDGAQQYAIQCDAAVRYRTCISSSCTAVTTDAKVQANELFDIPKPINERYLALISVSGTANCYLFKVILAAGQTPRRGQRGGNPAVTASGSSPAPVDAKYIVQQANGDLTAEQSMGALGTGLVLNTTTTGVQSIYAGTSCTNQFPRSLNASGTATCAGVADADLSNNYSGVGSCGANQVVIGTNDNATPSCSTLSTDALTGGILPIARGGTNHNGPYADDTVALSNGTLLAAAAVPNTATDNALTYNTTTNTFGTTDVSAVTVVHTAKGHKSTGSFATCNSGNKGTIVEADIWEAQDGYARSMCDGTYWQPILMENRRVGLAQVGASYNSFTTVTGGLFGFYDLNSTGSAIAAGRSAYVGPLLGFRSSTAANANAYALEAVVLGESMFRWDDLTRQQLRWCSPATITTTRLWAGWFDNGSATIGNSDTPAVSGWAIRSSTNVPDATMQLCGGDGAGNWSCTDTTATWAAATCYQLDFKWTPSTHVARWRLIKYGTGVYEGTITSPTYEPASTTAAAWFVGVNNLASAAARDIQFARAWTSGN